jgi:hypothetical protein
MEISMLTQLVHPADAPVTRKRVERAEGRQVQDTFTYCDGNYELTLIRPRASSRVVEAVRQGEAEFALTEVSPLLVVAFRFGKAVSWSPAVFDWPAIPSLERRLPPVGAEIESRALLHVVLIERENDPPLVWRNLTLSLDFTRILHGLIRKQAAIPIDPDERGRALGRLRRDASSGSLVSRAVARSLGSC